MKRPVFAFMLAAVCLPMAGCGGCGSSTPDVRRMARRKSAPDDAPAAVTPSSDKTAAEKAKAPSANEVSAGKVAATAAPPAETATSGAGEPQPTTPPVNNEKPAGPLSETERRARSIANLEKIAKALTAYVARHRKLPPQATSVDGDLYLSWRVTILPDLGYPELYGRFHHFENWDSKHNKLFLDYIPPEYQSPERFDAKTNYLGLAGPGMGLSSLAGIPTALVKDGMDNTLAVVEVDDKYAQEWTRPIDHIPQLELPSDKLGGLRGEGIFGILASGRVALLPRELPPSKLAALFTINGGEPIGAATFLKAPTAEPPPPALATIADDPAAANLPLESASANTATSAIPAAKPAVLPGSVPYIPNPMKEPVPDEESLAKARELLKELYAKDYSQARTRDQRQQFLKRLLAEAANVEEKAADFHEVLRIVRDMAVALGDVPSALAACDLLEQRFQLDPLPMRVKVLEDLNQQVKAMPSVAPALKEARRLARDAAESDRYDVALPLQELVLGFTRVQGDKTEITRQQQRKDSLETAKSLHTAAQAGLATLQANPGDAAANEAVGRYLCFVKDRWDAGLPYLAKAADIRLRGIASLELATDRSLEQTMSLAEQYWSLAGNFKQPQKRGLHLRSVYCYELAAPGLASSLEKVKGQRRLDEAVNLYGGEEVDRVLAPLRSARAGKSNG